MKAYRLIAEHTDGRREGLGNYYPIEFAGRIMESYKAMPGYELCEFELEPIDAPFCLERAPHAA